MSVDKIKEYTNGEITIVWKPKKCYHSGICVQTLPQVYKPNEKPWVQPENATTEQLKSQVQKCPSGALTYFMNDNPSDVSGKDKHDIEVLENGPLLVYGSISVKDKDGDVTTRNTKTAFCRCGASSKKPYCDGSHMKIDFQG
ncbi:(4Fe-4S)-binding protein [Portibacter marinus]|uniref:(4Fe-4S)-binding protein n=1 Tax=Portibacter marinus TaxID=2898660 RepID=UPI001F2BF7BF|nr:(4Fe-4S)-binding protein [Portibacter marinus]